MTVSQRMISLWGAGGVVLILLQAVIRLSRPAVEPFQRGDLMWWQWALYATCLVAMGYSEGYKAFQKQFSPRVVVRAWQLATRQRHPGWVAVAPLVCMGLIYATKRRLMISRSLLMGIIVLIILVRQLSYPYRGIVDGGVVLGLTWGIVAIVFLYWKAWQGTAPEVPAEFPEEA